MKRKMYALVMSMIVSSIFCIPVSADETTTNDFEEVNEQSVILADKTGKDKYGNIYRMKGSSSGGGHSAQSTTSFSIKLYKDGTKKANNYSKID